MWLSSSIPIIRTLDSFSDFFNLSSETVSEMNFCLALNHSFALLTSPSLEDFSPRIHMKDCHSLLLNLQESVPVLPVWKASALSSCFLDSKGRSIFYFNSPIGFVSNLCIFASTFFFCAFSSFRSFFNVSSTECPFVISSTCAYCGFSSINCAISKPDIFSSTFLDSAVDFCNVSRNGFGLLHIRSVEGSAIDWMNSV